MKRSRFFMCIFGVSAAAALGISLAQGYLNAVLNQPLPQTNSEQTRYLFVEPGSGVISIAYKAKSLGLIRNRQHFLLASWALKTNSKLRAGEYAFKGRAISLRQVIATLVAGKGHVRHVTIPEGLTVRQVLGRLKDSFGLIDDQPLLPEEGMLAPDTYDYRRGDKISDILGRMTARQKMLLAEAFAALDPLSVVGTEKELLILASIVERETALPDERPLVAAVFLNRIKKRMRLQSDPTVIYGIDTMGVLGRPISRQDLREVTPYNTYRINGLPPTAIANPGWQSLQAVVNPADVKYLYFVADGTGGHAFSKTLRDHNKKVKNWRRIEKSRR